MSTSFSQNIITKIFADEAMASPARLMEREPSVKQSAAAIDPCRQQEISTVQKLLSRLTDPQPTDDPKIVVVIASQGAANLDFIKAVFADYNRRPLQIDVVALSDEHPSSHPEREVNLTGREREVLVQIAEGFCNKEIANCLGVGVRTVETHRERIMRKLDIHNVAGLTRFAIGRGLVSLRA